MHQGNPRCRNISLRCSNSIERPWLLHPQRGESMELSRLLAIIRTHWVVASACVFALVLFTVAVSLLLPPKFTSTASLVVDVRGVNPVLGVSESNTVLPRTTLATQASMVRSEGVARKVVTQLG